MTENDEILPPGSKWADEEERKFYEDIPDLRDFVPASVLGVSESTAQRDDENKQEDEKERAEREKEEVRKLEEELKTLSLNGAEAPRSDVDEEDHDDEYVSLSNPLKDKFHIGNACYQCANPDPRNTKGDFAPWLPTARTARALPASDCSTCQIT